MSKFMCVWAAAVALLLAGRAEAAIRITEWMYNGDDGEFIEFTNLGITPIDMTGWSFADNNRTPGAVSLSSLGAIAAGESFLVTEKTAADFRTSWGLPASVKIVGENGRNLGRTDEINIYDASSALVDRLTYSDQDIAGSIRTQNFSGHPKTLAALGVNDVLQWELAAAHDRHGSFTGAVGNIGSPGDFGYLPEPGTLSLAAMAAAALVVRKRRAK